MEFLPNILTVCRFAFALWVPVCAVAPGGPYWLLALIFLLLATASDFLDGWLARRLRVESRIGAMLDPLADKVAVALGLAGLWAGGLLSGGLWAAGLIIVAREVTVGLLRRTMTQNGRGLPVSRTARVKTAVQLSALVALCAHGAVPALVSHGVGAALLWLAAGLSAWTAIDYVRRASATPATGARP